MHSSSQRRIRRVAALALTAALSMPLYIGPTAVADTSTIITDNTGMERFQVTTTDGATASAPHDVSSGQTIKVEGSGWLSTTGAGSTIVVKLYYETTDGKEGAYTRTGDKVHNHPRNGNPEPTIWSLLDANADGTFQTLVDLPNDITPGQKLVVSVTSGLANEEDIRRSMNIGPLLVDGTEWVDPHAGNRVTCEPTTPKPVVNVAESPDANGILHVSGTGFCHPTDGGSRIAIKIDDGAYSHVPGHTVHDNATIWKIVDADPKTGVFSVDLELPDGTEQGPRGSIPAFEDGSHVVRILTGTLKSEDEHRTIPRRGDHSTTFVVGEYRPTGLPTPVEYNETLTDAAKNGVTIARGSDALTVTVPGAQEGDWIYASAYITDSSRRLPWKQEWFRANSNGEIVLPLKDADIPEGKLKLTLQSGNRGKMNELIGWNWVTLKDASDTKDDKDDNKDDKDGEKKKKTDDTDTDDFMNIRGSFIFDILPLIAALGPLNGKLAEIYQILKGYDTEEAEVSGDADASDSDTAAADNDATATTRTRASARSANNEQNVVTIVRRNSGARAQAAPARASRPARARRAVAAQVGEKVAANKPQPEGTPKPPVLNASNLTPNRMGTVTSARQDDLVTVAVGDRKPGDWVYLFTYSPRPTPVGWAQLDDYSQLSLDVSGLGAGNHRIVLADEGGNLVGWTPVPGSTTRVEEVVTQPVEEIITESEPETVAAAAPLMRASDWLIIVGSLALVQFIALGALLLRRRS